MTDLLFTYGTLAPATDHQAEREGWQRDAVRGRLFDLGPYPALFDVDDPEADWVEGYLRVTTKGELEGDLDTYEGVEEGLFARVRVPTRSGRAAWVYVYARARPEYMRGPIGRWEGPRRPPNLRRASSLPAQGPNDSIEETTDG
jgi:gamma-glutamylcyclotransferase (GGCT)/AIG2-like uncharacterized protein YtfP